MPKLTWEELSTTPEFKRLTPKQQMFVATYIANGYDVVNAIRTAYKCANDKNAQIMSYTILRNFYVTMCLTLHFGEDPSGAFCDFLARDIMRGKLSKEQLEAYKLYAEIKGWHKSAVERAYLIAKEMGYGPAQAKKRDPGATNMKNKLKTALETAKKEAEDFDLSGFEEEALPKE